MAFFFVFFFENRAVYEKKWKIAYNPAGHGRQDKIYSMRIEYYVPKATNTHSELIIFIVFPLQTMVARTLLNVTLHSKKN